MIKSPKRRTLFTRMALTIAIVSILFQVFTIAIIGSLTLVPLGHRATEDLAALLVLSAKSWAKQPQQEKELLRNYMTEKLGLAVDSSVRPLDKSTSILPYFYFLEVALKQHTGTDISIKSSTDAKGIQWYWVDIPVEGRIVRIGFQRSRIGVYPAVALVVLMIVGTFVVLGTSILLARWLNRPLKFLANTIRNIGRGKDVPTVPETGPAELASVARSINAMNQQIQDLVADRTTLLAGMSHDLRSPLARVQIATEIMPEKGDPSLKRQIERDLTEMNRLIGECIAVSRGLHKEEKQSLDITEFIQRIIENFKDADISISIEDNSHCTIKAAPLALSRIISNLLSNAVRYSAGKTVEVILNCAQKTTIIRILDHGPGIPLENKNDVFEPFFRLETIGAPSGVGSGLGLFIVKQLVAANGWEIQLNSPLTGGTEAVLTIGSPKGE